MAMLAYAPAGFVLLREGQVGLAAIVFFGVLWVEPLPDADFWIPGLKHRGTSHSILSVLVVGSVLGGLGWLVGTHATAPVANVIVFFDTATAGLFAGPAGWLVEFLRRFDGPTLAVVGAVIGAYGIVAHLLADVITVMGIRPLLPVSRWRVSLSSLRANNALANNVLFTAGVLALVAVSYATLPGTEVVERAAVAGWEWVAHSTV